MAGEAGGRGSAVLTGPGVDAWGNAVLDPTKNVLDLVEASIRRQDDLRHAESEHSKEVGEMRARHMAEMLQAESARLDAIRAVDVGQVQRAAEVQATQALTLATQVSTSAEALRTQVAAAAAAQTTALAAALDPIQKDIADLRRAQYEQQGQKAQVSEAREGGSSRGMVIGLVIGGVALFVSFTFSVLGLALALYLATKGP